MIENNPKFGHSEQIKREKDEKLSDLNPNSGTRKPLFTLNACQDAKKMPRNGGNSPGFSKTPDIINKAHNDLINNDKKEGLQIHKQETSSQKKKVVYKNPNVKIGNGKLGPIELVIYKDDLYALKRVPKRAIDKPKRIQHLKQEKNVL